MKTELNRFNNKIFGTLLAFGFGVVIIVVASVFLFELLPTNVNQNDSFVIQYVEEASYRIRRNSSIVINSQPVGDKEYLFLPSGADYAHLSLYVNHRASISGTAKGKQLILEKNRNKCVNLMPLFGNEMISGVEYTLHIDYDENNYDLILIKSASVPSLHIVTKTAMLDLGFDKRDQDLGNLYLFDQKRKLTGSLKCITGCNDSSNDCTENEKSYAFCLNKERELINGCSLDQWRLLPNREKLSALQNTFEIKLYEAISEKPALPVQNIDLYVNGKYQGAYLLAAETENHPDWFVTQRGVRISVKGLERKTKEQETAIKDYIQGFEDAIFSPSGYNSNGQYYEQFVDTESLIRAFLYLSFIQDTDDNGFFFLEFDIDGQIKPIAWHQTWDIRDYSAEKNESLSTICDTYNMHFDGFKNYIWMEQLLTKGDFVSKLYETNVNLFSKIMKSEAPEMLDRYREEIKQSWILNDVRWNRDDTDSDCEQYSTAIRTRITTWKEHGEENCLQGISVASENGILKATVYGTRISLEWYRITQDNTLELVQYNDDRYIPTEYGLYIVCAAGPSFAYYNSLSDDVVYNAHYINKGQSLNAPKSITRMYSNPVYWDGRDIIADMKWITGIYSLTTGELTSDMVFSYNCSEEKYPKWMEAFLTGWNYNSNTSYMSLYKSGQYVGARYNGYYYDSDNQFLFQAIDYDEFALNRYENDLSVQNCRFTNDSEWTKELNDLAAAGKRYVEIQVSTTQELLKAIKIASEETSDSVLYTIVIDSGIYELWDALDKDQIGGTGDTIWCRGLELPDNCNLCGVGDVVISCTIPEDENSEVHPYTQIVSTLNLHNTNNRIRNIHFIGNNTRYCVHNDSGFGNSDNEIVFENCRFTHNGTESNTYWIYTPRCYGAGLLSGCRNTFRNCVFDANGNADNLLYIHTHSGENNVSNISCRIENCVFLAENKIAIDMQVPSVTVFGGYLTVNNCWFAPHDSILLEGVCPTALYGSGNSHVIIIDETNSLRSFQ